MSLFYKNPVDIEILFDGEDSRKHVEIPTNSHSAKSLFDKYPLFEDGESVTGLVTLRVREGRNLNIQVSKFH